MLDAQSTAAGPVLVQYFGVIVVQGIAGQVEKQRLPQS
jgi:hypothetical protein